jgi:hypothetical protein
METGKTEFNTGDLVIAGDVPFADWADGQKVVILEKHEYNKEGELDHPWRYVADFKKPSGDLERLNFYKATDPKDVFPPAAINTPVPDFSEYITRNEDGSGKILLSLNPASIANDVSDALVYTAGHQGNVIERWLNHYRPKTVGKLVMGYLEAEKHNAMYKTRMDQLHVFFAEMNQTVNQYADQNDLCSEYERAIDTINETINRVIPWCSYEFTGRTTEYEVTVSRSRTIIEQITLTVERTHQEDSYDFDSKVIEEAQASWDSEWEATDESYSTGDYEVIDSEKKVN